MTSNREMTHDLTIEKELNIYHLISQNDKIICMDIDPASQNTLLLIKREQQYELVLYEVFFNTVKKTLVNPSTDSRYLFKAIRLLPNGSIFMFGGVDDGRHDIIFYNSSLVCLWHESISGIDHSFIFNQDSIHVLIRNQFGFMLIKVDKEQPVFSHETPVPIILLSKLLKKNNETNHIFFYGIHILADNTIVVCVNHNGSLFLSFCKINNDNLVVDSVVEVDKMVHTHWRFSFFSSCADGEFILRLSPKPHENTHNVYYLKKLENGWEILPAFFNSIVNLGFDDAFRSAPFFVEGDKTGKACRLVDLKTNDVITFPNTCEFLSARDGKLYFLNEGRAFLLCFAKGNLLNTPQKSSVDLEHKASTSAILTLLDDLSNLSHNLQITETMLENKISSSFLNYYNSFKSGPFRMHVLKALTLIDLVTIGIEQGVTDLPNHYDRNMTFLILAGFIGCAFLMASLMVGYRSYKKDIHYNHNEGLFNARYETVFPLSVEEALDIQNTFATIEYKGSTATGNDMRTSSKFLADARKNIEAKISYIELRKNSLFSVLPSMPVDVKALVLEYAIDPEKDYKSTALTFGRE